MSVMKIISCYSGETEGFLAECHAHLEVSRVFGDLDGALGYAAEHNEACHRGRSAIVLRRVPDEEP